MIPHGADTALMFAARVGDAASAKLLVEAGANVNDHDAWGVSATTLAAFSGYGDVARYLLDKGADPNNDKPGFTALHCAIMRRDEQTVAALLARGADPNARVQVWTPTRRSSDDYHFMPALVDATPYWLAARFTQPAVMRLLAKHGADPKVDSRVELRAGRRVPAPEGADDRHHGGPGNGGRHRVGADRSHRTRCADPRNGQSRRRAGRRCQYREH